MFLRKRHTPIQPRKLLAHVLPVLTVMVYCTLATFGAFSGGMWGGVGIGFGVLAYLGTFILDRRWPSVARDFHILAFGSLVLMGLLSFFSQDTPQSRYDALRLFTIFLPLLFLTSPSVLRRAEHEHFFLALMMAIFTGAFALGVEMFLDAPVLHITKGDYAMLNQYNRGLSYLIVLSFPVMAAIWNRPFAKLKGAINIAAEKMVPFAIFVAALLFPASQSESRAAKLALILALFTVVLASKVPRLIYWCLNGSMFVLLSWPFVVQNLFLHYAGKLDQIPASWRARVEIWDYMSYRIMEHPWFGWGLGTSKLLDYKDPHGDMYKYVTANAPHPHNAVTQLWVELGLPGLALGVAFALLVLRQSSRLQPQLVPFAYGAWIAALTLSMVAYNLWTDSMFATFALTGFAFALLDKRFKEEKA